MSDPNIPNIPASIPADQVQFFSALKSCMEVLAGHGRNTDADRALRVQELKNLGIDISRFLGSSASKPYAVIPSSSASKKTPEAPRDLTVTKGPFSHTLSWTNPLDPLVSHIEVWIAEDSQDRGDAWLEAIVTVTEDLRGESSGYIFSGFTVTSDFTYWIRSIAYGDGNHSEWHPTDIQGGYVVTGDESIGETIDTIIDVLQGSTPPAYNSGTTYSINERCRTTDGRVWTSKLNNNLNHTPPNATYWERTGILMTGDVDGVPTVAIDGNLVVDGTLLARHIQTGSLTADLLAAAQVLVGHTLQNSGFVDGVSGWQLTNTSAKFHDMVMTFSGSGKTAAQSALNVADGADVTADQLIVLNPAFEQGLDNWGGTGATSGTVVPNVGVYGGNVIQLTGNNVLLTDAYIPVSTTKTYTARYRVKQTVNTAVQTDAKIYLCVLFYQADKTANSPHAYPVVNTDGLLVSDGWQDFSVKVGAGTSYSFNAGTAYVRIQAYVNWQGADGTAQIDLVDFFEDVSASNWGHTSDTTKIDGGDIYTGSITAGVVGTTELIAQTANLKNAVVETLKIKEDAVTIPVFSSSSTVYTGDGTNFVTIHSGSITLDYAATVTAMAFFTQSFAAYPAVWGAYLYWETTAIGYISGTMPQAGVSIVSGVDLSAGTHDFSVSWIGTTQVQAGNHRLVLLGTKR